MKKLWVLVLDGVAGKEDFYADPNKKNVIAFWKKAAPAAKGVKASIVKKAA